MRQIRSPRHRLPGPAAAMTAIVLAAMPLDRACAVDLLGLYGGAAFGRSQVQADAGGITPGNFEENHSAFKVMAGIRPISPLGAEIAYVDLGHPSGNLGGQPADVTIKGGSAFAMLYLPVPVVDVYAKLGVARLKSTLNAVQVLPGVGTCPVNAPNCALRPFRLDRTNTNFAVGAGAQFKLGSWAVRAEYERFDAAGANPNLLTVGLTWTFL
jgi:opacity protein-like surface antigen